MVQGVIAKGFYRCTEIELEVAYKELFGFAPCPNGTCKKINYKKVFESIVKQYNKVNGIKDKPKTGKYIWNPEQEVKVAFLRGYPVTAESDQETLEKLFNDPKRKGLVIINPNYKE